MVTETIESIGTSGRDRASIAAWEAILPADLVSGDVAHKGEVFNDSELTATAQVTFTNHVTDATRNIILRTGSGAGFKDHASVATNALRYNASLGAAHRKTSDYDNAIEVTSSCDFMEINFLQFAHDGDYPEQTVYLQGDNNVIRQSIIRGDSSRGSVSLDNDAVAVNCLIYTTGGAIADGISLGYVFSGNARAVACTVLTPDDLGNGGDGVKEDYGTNNESSNNASFGFTNSFTGTFNGSSDWNCSEDADAPGTNSLVSKTYSSQFENINNATLDARLKTGSDCLAAGDVPHALCNGVDILGNTRDSTNSNIGCWEVVAGGTTFFQTNTGSLTPSGILSKQTVKSVAGSVTSIGILTKSVSAIFGGSSTPSGILAAQAVISQDVNGSLIATGSISKQTSKVFGASVTPSGSLQKRIDKVLDGSLTPTGTVITSVVILLQLAGQVIASGSLATLFIAGVGKITNIFKNVFSSIFKNNFTDIGD